MAKFTVSAYEAALAALGLVMIAASWLPRLLTKQTITFPLLYVGAGVLLFLLPVDLPGFHPVEVGTLTERLTELAVIVSLMSAGLKLNRPITVRGWATTWRLLAITMPITIAAIAGLGLLGLGLALPAAVLLGAVLSPTDPVLANEVQVRSPSDDDEDQVRFSLTSEAGLNDGLAFPFVYLAIGLAIHRGEGGGWLWTWVGFDVLYRIGVGLLGGVAAGWGLARLLFHPPAEGRQPLAQAMEGSLALAATLLVYGMVELVQGYGFIAVFAAACTIRRYELDHEVHEALHTFTADVERVLFAVVLVLLGGAALTVLDGVTWAVLGVAAAVVLLVRPAAGLLALAGRSEPFRERVAIAFFGIRGIGSLYYLAYALTEADFAGAGVLWQVTLCVLLLSALVHGLTAAPAMKRLDAAATPRRS